MRRGNATQSEFHRLVKRWTHLTAEDFSADPESEVLWAEFDAFEVALV